MKTTADKLAEALEKCTTTYTDDWQWLNVMREAKQALSDYRAEQEKPKNELVELDKTRIKIILQQLAQMDCGDNSCLFAGRGKGGMRTNGGCQCYKLKADEICQTFGTLKASVKKYKDRKNTRAKPDSDK